MSGAKYTARALSVIFLLCIAAPVSLAADKNSSARSAENSSLTQEPKCVHGCERWGKVCNVDPRGAYKCRRRCEKFGKICE